MKKTQKTIKSQVAGWLLRVVVSLVLITLALNIRKYMTRVRYFIYTLEKADTLHGGHDAKIDPTVTQLHTQLNFEYLNKLSQLKQNAV